MVKRALISVSDKTGLIPFCSKLHELGIELVSTSGTSKAIIEAGLPCTLVEAVTGFPEMMNGRVRTLHPNIFAGVIADQNDPKHMETLQAHGIKPFGLVVVNLYPFAKKQAIENIDVGGPSMLQAAAKNYGSVAALWNTNDYINIGNQLEMDGEVSRATRLYLASKTFVYLAEYEAMVAGYFADCFRRGVEPEQGAKH